VLDALSIYGWRAADVSNLTRLKSALPHHTVFELSENYRSTQAIRVASRFVLSPELEGERRADPAAEQPTSSWRRHGHAPLAQRRGEPVVVYFARTIASEAEFVAHQIATLVGRSGGIIDFNDVAVLVRSAVLACDLTSALAAFNVPTHSQLGAALQMAGDRIGASEMLAWLAMTTDPTNLSAFAQAITSLPRGIGKASAKKFIEASKATGVHPLIYSSILLLLLSYSSPASICPPSRPPTGAAY
jgi:DNA helicase II / ATP-dependent DNA helicase PcrA